METPLHIRSYNHSAFLKEVPVDICTRNAPIRGKTNTDKFTLKLMYEQTPDMVIWGNTHETT